MAVELRILNSTLSPQNSELVAQNSKLKAQPSQLLFVLASFGIVLLAVALRVWFWSWQARSGAVQPGDPEEYYRAALHILQGAYHDTGKWLRPPLYPAFLAAMFALGGVDVSFALLGQAIVSGFGVLAFVLLGAWLFERRAVGLSSGLMAALFVPLASFGSVLFAEAQFVTLVVLGLALFDRALVKGGWRWALASGIVFGLAALTRATALFFIPVGALLLVVLRRHKQSPLSRLRAPLAAFLLGAVLVIAPWTLRNYLVHQRFILVDTNGGISMWYGTVRSAEDERQGEAQIFSLPNLADRQSLAVRMTLERIREDPAWFFGRIRFKIASLFLLQSRSFAVGEVVTISPRDEQIALSAGENPLWLSLIADTQYVLIMLGGIIGLAWVPSWRRALPLLAWFVVGVLLSAITVAHHRLRLPLVGVMIPFAAYALLLLFDRRRPSSIANRPSSIVPRLALAVCGCLAFLALIFSFRYLTWARGERYAFAGRQAMARGDYAAAYTNFSQARAADPNNALRAIDLADFAFERNEMVQATALFSAAVALEPRNLYAHAMLLQTAVVREQPAEAQAAQAAIAGYGRDNNDLYRWAWDHARTSPPAQAIPGDARAFGHYEGFAPATFDLPAGRWTLGQARLRVRGSCGVVHVRLRGPSGREAIVALERSGLTQRVTLDGAEQDVALNMASIRECDVGLPVVISIDSATGLLDLERAPWAVGVAVLDARVEP